MNEISYIGKDLKELRAKYNETASDMAAKLGISISLLSNIERGRKYISCKALEKLKSSYNLSDNEFNEIAKHINSKDKFVMLNISNAPVEKRELALFLSKNYQDIPIKEIRKMMRTVYLL